MSPQIQHPIFRSLIWEIEGLTWEQLDATTQNGLLDFNRFIAPDGESVTVSVAASMRLLRVLARDDIFLLPTGVIRYLLRQSGTDADVRPGTWRDIEF